MDDWYHMMLQALLLSIPMTITAIVNFLIQLLHKRLSGNVGSLPGGASAGGDQKHSHTGSPTGKGDHDAGSNPAP